MHASNIKKIKFWKMHGLGNDFVIWDFRKNVTDLRKDQISLIANRKFGLGCDQLIIIKKGNKFFDVEAIIFEDGQFIKSNEANIEIENKNYNIIFYKGERVILNNIENTSMYKKIIWKRIFTSKFGTTFCHAQTNLFSSGVLPWLPLW